MARIGNTKTKFFIDIGVGDVVTPKNITIHLTATSSAPLFEKELSLCGYPIEVIFAEKFETALNRGGANSRMKDFHDMILLVRSGALNVQKLKPSVRDTFSNRGTALRKLELSDAEWEILATRWQSFRKKLDAHGQTQIPGEIKQVVSEINNALVSLGVLT